MLALIIIAVYINVIVCMWFNYMVKLILRWFLDTIFLISQKMCYFADTNL